MHMCIKPGISASAWTVVATIGLCGGRLEGAAPVPKADFYVATQGNDAWSGTLPAPNADGTNGPFATLHRARDAVRTRRAAGGHNGPLVVMVRSGTYYLKEPLSLGVEDSGTKNRPVIYAACPGEDVTLSGGRPITGWHKRKGPRWIADIPDTKVDLADGGWYFRQLFVGDARQIRARTPNFDPEHPTTGGWAFVLPFSEKSLTKGRGNSPKDRFRFRPGDLEPWPLSPAPEIHIFPAWGWVNAILSVAEIDHQNGIVHVTNRNCTQELRPGNRYFVENVFEALDTPGEWYLDAAEGRLHYWPKEADFAGKQVVAPALDHLIDITGVPPKRNGGHGKPDASGQAPAPRFAEHIVLRGFTFRHTRYSLEVASLYTPDDAVVHLRWARHCTIEDCKFLGVGGYAVRLSEYARDNRILGNTVAEAGQGGVLMVGSDTPTQPKDNVVAGNHIHDCGKIWKHVAGVYVTTGSGNRIAHNTITDVPRYAISLKSSRRGNASHNNTIEYNRMLRTNLETNDTGAIETLGRDREDTGNVIRNNLILDVVGLKTSETGKMLTPFYTWGIYLDDYSSGTIVSGNIVARTFRGGIHVHLGRNNVFENNILMDGRNRQSEYNGADFMSNNRFVKNIVYYHSGALLRVNRWHDKVLAECDHNLYWRVGGNLTEAEGKVTPKGSLKQWREAGYDKHSLVADPLFVDPTRDDYRLRPESPAFKLGFKPIDVGRIGVEGYEPGKGDAAHSCVRDRHVADSAITSCTGRRTREADSATRRASD